jgi:isopentenyl phosphate kinase
MKLALVKLGGSVITFKDRPLSANAGAIDAIAKELAGGLDMPLIIVHGGGSFGHHWSVKYDMHTKPAPYDAHGVAVVHESMVALNQIIVNAMIKAGSNPYAVPPPVYTAGHKPVVSKIKDVAVMAQNKVVPVTFGDVVHMGGRNYSILSGDSLMTIIAKALRPSQVIFATNVDGIYKDMATKEVVPVLKPKSAVEFSKVAGADVTGGMQRKVMEAFKIASLGMDVMLVNGLVPERIAQAAGGGSNRKDVVGTLVKGKKN